MNTAGAQIGSDIRNDDRDTRTNLLANVAWADIHGNWPGTSLPVQLDTVTFTVQFDFPGDRSIFTKRSWAAARKKPFLFPDRHRFWCGFLECGDRCCFGF